VRWRTPVAAAAVLLGLALYAMLAATVGGWIPDHWAAELLYYLAAGLLWVWPAARVIAWSARDGG
jgi:hypothetical protein